MRIRGVKVGAAIISISIASLIVPGLGGSDASAAVRANTSKFCKDYRHDTNLLSHASNVHQLAGVPTLVRKLASEGPSAMKKGLDKLAGEVHTIVKAGGYTSKAEETSFTSLSNSLLSQEEATCAGK